MDGSIVPSASVSLRQHGDRDAHAVVGGRRIIDRHGAPVEDRRVGLRVRNVVMVAEVAVGLSPMRMRS